MKNKLFADALIVVVISLLPNLLVAASASANRPAEQKPPLERTCEQPLQLIPMLMGHTNLAQFALLGLQFPEEALDPAKKERVIHIGGTQQPLKRNIPCSLDRNEVTCGGIYTRTLCRPAGQRFMSI